MTSQQLRCAALLTTALTLAPRVASAQQWQCYPFLPSETAAAAAARLAGEARAFEILDLSSSRFVPKNRYNRIRPDWVACAWVTRNRPARLTAAAASQVTWVSSGTPQTRDGLRPDPLWLLLVLLLAAPFARYQFHRAWKERRIAIDDMTRFGTSVIEEFARPLVQPRDPAAPLRTRLRFKPYRSRLEVLLAPAPGRSYPNLSDHRRNVEYDVERVRQILGDGRYVIDAIRQRGEWVVLGFRGRQQEKAGVM